MGREDSYRTFNFEFPGSEIADRPIVDRHRELGAFETLFLEPKMTFLKIARLFGSSHRFVPSSLYSEDIIRNTLVKLKSALSIEKASDINFVMRGETVFPEQIVQALPQVQLLYYKGNYRLTRQKCVAIVGSRRASTQGMKIAARIAKELVDNGFVIVSGLAEGIDKAAHQAAIDAGGNTIGVLGTPIHHFAGRGREKLAIRMSTEQLLISQIPVLHYERCDQSQRNRFFLERNSTISALSMGTIVVEAEEKSGSLATARRTLEQGRKLFIPASCFKNPRTNWPITFKELGAIRFESVSEIIDNLFYDN